MDKRSIKEHWHLKCYSLMFLSFQYFPNITHHLYVALNVTHLSPSAVDSRRPNAEQRKGTKTQMERKNKCKNISDHRAGFKMWWEEKRDCATSKWRRTDAHVHNTYWITAAQCINLQSGGKTKMVRTTFPSTSEIRNCFGLPSDWSFGPTDTDQDRLLYLLTSCFTVTARFASARFCSCIVHWQNDMFKPIRNFQIFHLTFDASLLSA